MKRTRTAESWPRPLEYWKTESDPARKQGCLHIRSGTKYGPFLKLAVLKEKSTLQPQRLAGSETWAI